jgi:hypothetical protein
MYAIFPNPHRLSLQTIFNDQIPNDHLFTVFSNSVCGVQRRYNINGIFQMQGGKNWILPK